MYLRTNVAMYALASSSSPYFGTALGSPMLNGSYYVSDVRTKK